MQRIETERLILRDFEDRDAEPFFEFLSDRDCCYFDGGYEPESSRKSKFYRKCMKLFRLQRRERFMIELKAEQRCIGTIHLMEADNRQVYALEIGYGICPAYQGRGYATEAVRAAVDHCFEELGVEMLTAKTIPQNLASLRLLARLGFQKEGVRHKAAKYPPVGIVDYECFYLERDGRE